MKIAIVGAGKLGTAIASALINGGHDITLLDNSEERSQNISQNLDVFTITADAKKIDVLKDMRINEYDLLISATDNDERNIVVCSFAKKLGCPKTIARVRAPEHVEQLDFIKENMGIDFIINPDKACADEIFKFITREFAISGGKISKDGVGVLEFRADKMPELLDRQVKDTKELLEDLLIAAISREGKVLIPNGSTLIKSGDTVCRKRKRFFQKARQSNDSRRRQYRLFPRKTAHRLRCFSKDNRTVKGPLRAAFF